MLTLDIVNVIDCVSIENFYSCYDHWQLFKFGLICFGCGFSIAILLIILALYYIFYRDDPNEIT